MRLAGAFLTTKIGYCNFWEVSRKIRERLPLILFHGVTVRNGAVHDDGGRVAARITKGDNVRRGVRPLREVQKVR